MESVRIATVADLPELERLSRSGREGVVDARGGALWLDRDAPGPVPDVYARAMASPRELLVVGCIDEVPLGFQYTVIDDHTGRRRLAVVRELFVEPEARGVGLGEAMMNHTVAWAADDGCVGIDGYALPGDRATKNFFETFGLVARGIVVHRVIDP